MAACLASLFILGCFFTQSNGQVTVTRTLAPFTAAAINGGLHVDIVINPSTTERVRITAPTAAQIALISTSVQGGQLVIGRTGQVDPDDIEITLFARTLRAIDANQFSRVEVVRGQLSAIGVRLAASGGSTIIASVATRSLEVQGNGAATFSVSGNAMAANVRFSGAVLYSALDLQTSTTFLEGSGSINAVINASDRIFGSISGSALLSYTDNPRRNVTIDGFLQWNQI